MTPATNTEQRYHLAEQVEAFEHQGYVHLSGIFNSEQISAYQRLRELAVLDWQFTHGLTDLPDAVEGLVERFPQAGLLAITHPVLLGVAEATMGPVVQLDSAVLAGDLPTDPSQRGRPVAWHRDRFGFFPVGAYTRPLSIIVLVYLQEMTDNVGPLRVIPRSHVEPVAVADDSRDAPHPDEVLLHTVPGDAVIVHHNLLHSGTRNTSDRERSFLGIVYNISGLVHQDTFTGPNCQAIVATARRTNDRRMLRLLGQDPLIVPRQNSGFRQPPQQEWATWHQEDEAYAGQAVSERSRVERSRAARSSTTLPFTADPA